MSALLPDRGLELALPPSSASDLAARLEGAGARLNESASALLAHSALVDDPPGAARRTLPRGSGPGPRRDAPPADRHGRAPTGFVHVLSPSLSAVPDLHRGFYLRVVDGTPWLRGFLCDDLHVFGPEDRWVLCAAAPSRVSR